MVACLPLVAFFIFISQQDARRPQSPRIKAAEAMLEVKEEKQQDARDRKLVKQLLSEELGKRRFSFSSVVEAATGKQVIPFNEDIESHLAVKTALKTAMTAVLAEHNDATSPTRSLRRINEASRFFEESLIRELNALPDFSCTVPTLSSGKILRSGYPDLRLIHTPTGLVTYLDPKLLEEGSLGSTLRSFYYSPRTQTNKITENALHLLIGIEHDGKDGAWTFLDWQLSDLSQLKIRLKAEFQASNFDVYGPDLQLR